MAERTRIGRLDEKGYKADNAVIGTGGGVQHPSHHL